MGNQDSRLRVESEPGLIGSSLKAFNQKEKKNIAAVRVGLEKRFPYLCISHETLKQVFPIPMPVASKFCQAVDEFNAEIIDFDPLFKYIYRYNEGDMIDKATMLFEMFGLREIKREGRKVMFLVLSILVTPISMYFAVNDHHNMTPQLTWKQKSFIKRILEKVFGEKKIEVSSDGKFDPKEFMKWLEKSQLISELEQTLVTASEEIKRPDSAPTQTNKEEVRMEKLQKYLNRRFPYKTISFETMLEHFPMPGEFGPQFCKFLDSGNSQIIDFPPFTNWLKEYAKADVYKKVQLLCLVYGDGKLVEVPLQEMINLFSVLLMPFVRFFPVDNPKRNAEMQAMPQLGAEEEELLQRIFESCELVGENTTTIESASFLQWFKGNEDLQNDIGVQLGMFESRGDRNSDPIDFICWHQEDKDDVELVAGDSIELKLQCHPMVKGGNIRFTFKVPDDYREFISFEPNSVVIPQNSDLSEHFLLSTSEGCPLIPPEINVIAEAIEGSPNLKQDQEEFELDYIDFVEPTSTLNQQIIDFLRMQFDFATNSEQRFFDEESLNIFMHIGHPSYNREKIAKGVVDMLKILGSNGRLYWRGFLKYYEKMFTDNKKKMREEMLIRGLTDRSKSDILPLPIYQFLLYNYQSYTAWEGVFTEDSLARFYAVGFPDAPPQTLRKGVMKVIRKYGHVDEEGTGKVETSLDLDGFLNLYEDSYAKSPHDVKVEFEKRGFMLHKMATEPKPKKRRMSSSAGASLLDIRRNMPNLMRTDSVIMPAHPGSPRKSGRLQTFRASEPVVKLGRMQVVSSSSSPKKPVKTPTKKAPPVQVQQTQKASVQRKQEDVQQAPPASGCCIIS